MMKTAPFDAAVHLDDTESQEALIKDALESGDPQYIAHARDIIDRARGMMPRSTDTRGRFG